MLLVLLATVTATCELVLAKDVATVVSLASSKIEKSKKLVLKKFFSFFSNNLQSVFLKENKLAFQFFSKLRLQEIRNEVCCQYLRFQLSFKKKKILKRLIKIFSYLILLH